MSNQLDPSVSPRQLIRARAILAPAGAWDATPLELFCSGANHVMLFLDYVRGGAAGAVDVQLQAAFNSVDQAGEPDWYPWSAFAVGAVAAGVQTQSRVQDEIVTYQATGGAQEMYIIGPIELQSCVERLRLLARESGNVGAPGTLGVWIGLG